MPTTSIRSVVYAGTLLCVSLPAYAQDPVLAPPIAATDSSPAAAALHGRALADQRGMGGRFGGGLAAGLTLGIFGAGMVYIIAGSDDAYLAPTDALRLSGANPTYSLAFQQGYSERLKARRKSSALKGGLLGTLALVTLIVVSNASSGGN